jgi:hypothetical protein
MTRYAIDAQAHEEQVVRRERYLKNVLRSLDWEKVGHVACHWEVGEARHTGLAVSLEVNPGVASVEPNRVPAMRDKR